MLVEGDEIKHLRKAFSANGNIFLCVCVCVSVRFGERACGSRVFYLLLVL